MFRKSDSTMHQRHTTSSRGPSPHTRRGAAKPAVNSPESGFTLVEAMIATLVLMFGLAAIFNLMIVATSSNSVANRASAATGLASQQMEVLRSTAFSALTDSPTGVDTLETVTANFNMSSTVEGVGTFVTTWRIQTLTDPNLKLIQVRTDPNGFRGRWARAEFTAIRSCTLGTAAGCL
jgi:Tfp pilus assembly protein PilV